MDGSSDSFPVITLHATSQKNRPPFDSRRDASLPVDFQTEVGHRAPLKDFLDLVMGIRPSADDSYAGRVQKQVEAAKRSSALRREYMNWEMTLLVERDKGRAEGKAEGIAEGKAEGRTEGDSLRLIRQILLKLDKGKSEDVIASEVEEDPAVVHQFASIAARMDDSDPEKILKIYSDWKKED